MYLRPIIRLPLGARRAVELIVGAAAALILSYLIMQIR
jgi:hypothetical protein